MRHRPAWTRMLAVGALGLLVAAALIGGQLLRLGGDPTAPFHVGQTSAVDDWLRARGVEVTVSPHEGYDGQFFLGLAHDPLLRDGAAAAFDAPRYRAGRPLYPWVGTLLVAGRRPAIAFGLLAAGALAVGLGCACAAYLLAAHGVTRWAGLLFAVVPGVAIGLVRGTAEPLGLALAMLGLALVHSGRLPAAGAVFAAVALTKETYLAFAAAAVLWLLLDQGERPAGDRRLRRAAGLLTPALLALAAWTAYVFLRAPAKPNDQVPYTAFGRPLWGWLEALGAAAGGRYRAEVSPDVLVPVLLAGSLAVIVAALVAGLRGSHLPGRTGLVLGAYGLLLSPSADRLLSSMRILAPSVLAGLLALAPAVARAGRSPGRRGPGEDDRAALPTRAPATPGG